MICGVFGRWHCYMFLHINVCSQEYLSAGVLMCGARSPSSCDLRLPGGVIGIKESLPSLRLQFFVYVAQIATERELAN